MSDYRIIESDCIEAMAAMPEASVDAIVTDPPYGLGFMGKHWDSPGGLGDMPMRRNHATNTVNTGASRQGGRQRASSDFLKRQARDARTYQEWCEGWGRAAERVLRPGGYILAFGGTRTYHRLTCGLEDAGFEVRDMVEWLYGSGFPKHESCLKPAHEPIMLGRKAAPRSEALQIDACRIAAAESWAPDERPSDALNGYGPGDADGWDGGWTKRSGSHEGGRWPANVVLDEEAAALLDAQTGILTSGSGPLRRNADKFGRNTYGVFKGTDEVLPPGDSGGASRFFYCAKATGAERGAGDVDNDHPTVKPIDLMRWLCRLITPPGGTVLDPFTGSGTTGCAAVLEDFDFIGIEREAEYVAIAEARIAHWWKQPVQLGLGEEAA